MRIVKINGTALRNYITDEIGITLTEAGRRIGYSKSYISNICADNVASEKALMLITNILEVPEEILKPEDEMKKALEKKAAEAERLRFFEDCEERISNAIVTINAMVDMCDKLLLLKDQGKSDMEELMKVQRVYQSTVERIKKGA